MIVDAGAVAAHWPELAVGARETVVFCSCGAEFRCADRNGRRWTTRDLWASHLAAELNRVRA